MRKYIGISLTLICLLALTACGSPKKIVLPESKNIKEIEIMRNTSESGKKILGKDEIDKFLAEIKDNTKDTKRESLNDQPTNVDEYFTIKFLHTGAEGASSVAYIYREKGNSYMEQPYSGIWLLEDSIYDRISDNIGE